MKEKMDRKNKSTLEQLKKKCNSRLTDIVGGPMDIYELHRELMNLVLHHSPEYIIVLIEKNKDIKKYKTTIYITKEDFERYK